ncbi:MAG TPA: 50S ribosomal protein L19 [Candidatus Bathyarchaeia archaeon]|nr:50S ribosomal protein L19 [Candidatus Bathyarchaeia archaeon]
MDILDQIAAKRMKESTTDFGVGDTVRVDIKVIEGDRERVQAFQGIVLQRRGSGLGETFTVRKVSQGVGVERVFPLHSPNVSAIRVLRKGKVRRAKLFYLRGLKGKAARISERTEKVEE